MNIRLYKIKDFPLLNQWWIEQNEPAPTINMLPEESTFVLEVDKKPIASLCLYLTNCKEFCYIENFIADPNYKNPNRRFYLSSLIAHAEGFAKKLGYKKLLMLSYREKLKQRYQDYGYQKTIDNISSFVKELN